jgi:hypothetical protein
MAVLEKTADQLEAQFVILSVLQTVYTLLGSRMRENPEVRVGGVFGLRMRWGCAAPQACCLVDLAGGFGERVWSRLQPALRAAVHRSRRAAAAMEFLRRFSELRKVSYKGSVSNAS